MADRAIPLSHSFFNSYPQQLKKLHRALDEVETASWEFKKFQKLLNDMDTATWQARQAYQGLRDIYEKIDAEQRASD